VLGLVGSFVLLVLGDKGSPGVRWLLQGIFAVLILLGAEPLLGNWIQASAEPYQIKKLELGFDLLWWVVPAVFVNLAVDVFVWKPTEKRTGQPVPTLLRYSVAFVIYLFALFGVVAFVYDYRLTGILATSGMLAMIIGLAVQLNITNLFAGVALNLERPFRVGDWVMIHGRTPDPDNGVIGKVIDINWRTTRLQTADDTVIVIPNGIISEKTITNFMAPGEVSRFDLFFTVDQTVPPDRVLTVIRAALDSLADPEHGSVLVDPPPSVRIRRVTENGVEYLVRYRVMPSQTSPTKARHLVNECVIRHLRDAGIELAYPRRRVQEVPATTPSE
jgi:branched-chain amino acid transport system substrate-binding protein